MPDQPTAEKWKYCAERVPAPCVRTARAGSEVGLPGGDRTPDNRLRRPVLYPTELRAETGRSSRCNGTRRISMTRIQKKPTVGELFCRNFGRSTRIRTLDPLVPNQVRYQTAPHSDKSQIIAGKQPKRSPAPFFCADRTGAPIARIGHSQRCGVPHGDRHFRVLH